jgi:hypothetical protein
MDVSKIMIDTIYESIKKEYEKTKAEYDGIMREFSDIERDYEYDTFKRYNYNEGKMTAFAIAMALIEGITGIRHEN